jgi:hypothetical protein
MDLAIGALYYAMTVFYLKTILPAKGGQLGRTIGAGYMILKYPGFEMFIYFKPDTDNQLMNHFTVDIGGVSIGGKWESFPAEFQRILSAAIVELPPPAHSDCDPSDAKHLLDLFGVGGRTNAELLKFIATTVKRIFGSVALTKNADAKQEVLSVVESHLQALIQAKVGGECEKLLGTCKKLQETPQ